MARMKHKKSPEFKVKQLSEKDLSNILKSYEKKHGMSSAEFYVKYNRGKLADEREYSKFSDFIKWASYYDMAAKAGILDSRLKV